MTEHIKISSGAATATIIPSAGALLAQITVDQKNLLTPPFVHPTAFPGWPSGGCPILFPWAGRVRHDDVLGNFSWDGKIGAMPIHGNLYQKSADIISVGNDFAKLSMPSVALGDQGSSPSVKVLVTYRLQQQQIAIHLNVQGIDGEYPCAPGIHPFFALAGDRAWSCKIDADFEYDVTPRGLASFPMPNTSKTYDVFAPKMQSRIFSKMNNNELTLSCRSQNICIRSEPKADVTVVYRAPDQSFFCLEPWAALPNAVANRSGISLLKSTAALDFSWTISWEL